MPPRPFRLHWYAIASVAICLTLLARSAAHPEFKFAERPWLGKHSVYSTHGIVSTMHPLASQAGIDIMKRGGNAFEELKQEYFDWGETQGGRGGRAWGIDHARNRRTRLSWWQDQLGLESLGDLVGILPRAEKALRELLKTSAERML